MSVIEHAIGIYRVFVISGVCFWDSEAIASGIGVCGSQHPCKKLCGRSGTCTMAVRTAQVLAMVLVVVLVADVVGGRW